MTNEQPIDPLANEIRQLADDIFRDKVLRARKTPPAQKFLDGMHLFDWACRQTLSGIRHRYPDRNPAEHFLILKQRLANSRRMNEAGIYSSFQDEQ